MTYLTSRHLASKRLLRLLLACAALLILLLSGCGRSATRRTLLHAESIMEEHPDSAYALLSALRVDSAAPEEDRALHALLLTQAMHKTYRLWENSEKEINHADSLIGSAVDYYRKNSPDSMLMKACYYQGEVKALSQDNFIDALDPLSQSLDIALEREDNLWVGRIYSSMAHVYFAGGAFGDEVEAQEKAVDYFRRSGNEDFTRYAVSEYATALFNAGRCGEAITVANMLKDSISPDKNPDLWVEISSTKAMSHFFNHENQECIDEIASLDSLGLSQPALEPFRILSLIYLGQSSKGKEYYTLHYEEIEERDRMLIEDAFACERSDKATQARTLRWIYKDLLDQYERYTATGFNTMQMMVNRSMAARHKEEQTRTWIYIILIIIASGAALWIMGSALYKMYLKKRLAQEEAKEKEERNTELEKNISEIEADRDSIRTKREELERQVLDREERNSELERNISEIEAERDSILSKSEELEKQVIQLTDTLSISLEGKKREYENLLNQMKEDIRFLTLKAVCSEFRLLDEIINLRETLPASSDRDTRIINRMLANIRVEGTEKKKVSELEKRVNKAYGNIMQMLRKEVYAENEIYYQAALLRMAGFSISSIASLTGLKDTKAVNNVVRRIREKIDMLPAEQQEKFSIFMSGKITSK
ncbi:MAG: hypothetical protein K2M67_04730 [Muribaculaceae bacterium]|nr:hypothetical protein [Muribaculaceae bacterium]